MYIYYYSFKYVYINLLTPWPTYYNPNDYQSQLRLELIIRSWSSALVQSLGWKKCLN